MWTPPRKVSEVGSVGLGCCLEACCVLACVGVTKVGTSGVDCSRVPQKLSPIVKELRLARTRWDKSGTCLPKKMQNSTDKEMLRDPGTEMALQWVAQSLRLFIYFFLFHIVAGLLCGTVCAFAMWCMQYVQTCVTNFSFAAHFLMKHAQCRARGNNIVWDYLFDVFLESGKRKVSETQIDFPS